MVRTVSILVACLVANACAVLEIPETGENEDWVSQRLAQEQMERVAPEAIPQTRMSRNITIELDQSAQTVMERRDQLNEEEIQSVEGEKTTTEDFVDSGIARTTPPD